jgi:hypothetical protein
MLAPKILVKKYKKHHRHNKEPVVLASDAIRNIAYQQPRLSFSLPSTVNLTKLNVFAARPQLLHNSTTSPLNHRRVPSYPIQEEHLNEDILTESQTVLPVIRKPLPPQSPPIFKVDAAAQNVMASRVLMTSTPHILTYASPKEKFIDAETENEAEWHHRRNRIHSANRADASNIQLHLINHLRHRQHPTTQEDISTLSTIIQEETTTIQTTTTQATTHTYNVKDDAHLIKLLRQFRLKPDESQIHMNLRKIQPFDAQITETPPKAPNEENTVKIFTPNKQVIREEEKVFFVDGSTETQQEATTKHPNSMLTTSLRPKLLHLKSGSFKHKIKSLPIDAESNKPLYGYRHKILSIRRRGDADTSSEIEIPISPKLKSGHVKDADSQLPIHNSKDEQLER